jgi:hypothetical protein
MFLAFCSVGSALAMPRDRLPRFDTVAIKRDMHTRQKTKASNLGIERGAPFGRRRISL